MTELIERLPLRTGRRAAAGAGPRPGLVLAVVLTGQLMAVLDTNIVNVAIPSMHADLHASGALLQLIVAGYTIAYAVLLITGARLGDILGHRRVFRAGVLLFTLASLGCGLAPTAGVLVGLRFAQGVGAAVMIPQVLSLLQRTYQAPGPRARAMSLYATVISGGAVLGQVVGGLLISADVFGSTWRSVFLVNVPIGIAVLLCTGMLPGVLAGIGGLFAAMMVFGGWLFGFALELQDGLGESALRAGLTFAPAAVAFALVSLNWQRLPARYHAVLPAAGFVVNGLGLLALALLFRSGDDGTSVWVYVASAVAGAGMAGAFGPLMTRVLSRVPVAIAADASGVVVTVNQLGIVTGVATFGTLYLNLAGRLPGSLGGSSAFAISSANAYLATSIALAALGLLGGFLAVAHVRVTARHALATAQQ